MYSGYNKIFNVNIENVYIKKHRYKYILLQIRQYIDIIYQKIFLVVVCEGMECSVLRYLASQAIKAPIL